MRCRTTGVEGGRNHVVDVEKKVGGVKAVVEDEQRRVHLGLNEAERHDVLGEMLEPHTWCLAKSVERPREQTHSIWLRGVGETGGLLTVDLLMEIAMKKCIGDIELVSRPSVCGDESEDGADCRRLDDGRESLAEVDARPLIEAVHHPSGFVAFQRAIGVEFVLEHPFAGDDARARRARNEGPGLVLLQRMEFMLHRGEPIAITKCLANRCGYGRDYSGGWDSSSGHGIASVLGM
jgi:hypothetical protein